MSLHITLYPDTRSTCSVDTRECNVRHNGRVVVAVTVDGCRIQSNGWEAMQRVVDALTEAITAAQETEAREALPGDAEVTA